MRSKPWTADETARALSMRARGMRTAYIAEALGRTPKAVQVKLSNISMTPEKRERRRQYQRDRNAERFCTTKIAGIKFETMSKAPDDVLSERSARSGLQHRNLTAALCGDPLPGYSALDRRGGV